MLKTREPLKLHTMDIAASGAEQFFERIASNYEQIDARINGTDLLHMVTKPPEIFFAEGDETVLYNSNINIENRQTQKVEILNNLVNRILLSTKGQFTYQDQVYVSNTLKKLGITNEQQFIRDIYNNINATKNIRTAIENIERIAGAVTTQVENVHNISFNRYERNYIAGEIAKLSLNYENRFFTEFNKLVEENDQTEILVNEVTGIVNRINESAAETLINRINEDSRSYITNRLSSLTTEEKNAFYEQFNRFYDNSYYKDYSIEKLEKLIVRAQETARARMNQKNPVEQIREMQLRQATEHISPLYQTVVNRLELADSYHALTAKYDVNASSTSFTNAEVNLTSFSRIINEVNLKNAKDVLIAPAEISYTQGNVYEQQTDLTELTEETVNQQLIKAILYSIIDTAFNSAINRSDRNVRKWYQITNNLYTSADHTINRFEENLITPIDRSVYQSLTEEAIIEQLEHVEIENNRRVELYEQALENERKLQEQAQPKRKTASKAKEESIDALTNPQEFLEKVRVEKEQAAIRKAFENKDALERLPAEIRDRVQLIQAIMTTDENGSLTEEGLQVIANVKNEIFNNTASTNRIERIHQTINQELAAGLITEVEERAILQELSEVNTLLKEDRKENQSRTPGQESPKKAHAMEILNKIEQKINHNITRVTEGDITNVTLDHRPEEVLSPELRNIVENISMSPGQTLLGDTIVEAMQPQMQKAVLENIRPAAQRAAAEAAAEDLQRTVNTFVRKKAPVVVNKVTEELESVNLVHKSTEQVNSEEILERLEEQKQILQTERVINTTNQTIVTEKNTTETTKRLIKNEIENLEIQDQIDRTVQRQIHSFETEMFDKLENRLDNERRRRGY